MRTADSQDEMGKQVRDGAVTRRACDTAHGGNVSRTYRSSASSASGSRAHRGQAHKAILVGRDSYLLELVRYVVLNPVRAGMVADVAQWPWSSYGAMIGTAPAPPWLDVDVLLGLLALASVLRI